MNKKIVDLIEQNVYAVVSSVNRAEQPESALVGVSQTPDLALVFASTEHTRKIGNLRLNPNIALVIGGSDGSRKSVQIEGTARVLTVQDAQPYLELHYKKIPSAKMHQHDGGECFVVVTPVWARYTDYSGTEPEVFEEHYDAD